MKKFTTTFAIALVFLAFYAAGKKEGENVFIVKPYLQIGKNPSSHSLDILWQAKDEEAAWKVEIKTDDSPSWTQIANPDYLALSVKGLERRRLYSVTADHLVPGKDFMYRISKNKSNVFTSQAHAPRSAEQSFRFVASGDIGAGTADAKLIAEQIYQAKPDLVVVPGDIVYEHGLISEYDKNFWPVYNADSINHAGAPLMRSIPFAAAPGNHDTEEGDFARYPDALAYFLFWDQPVNGLPLKDGDPFFPAIKISDSARQAFMKIAGEKFPTMTNFSFNYGNAHWLMLDANNYVDWTNDNLVNWVKKDLESAAASTWKFVVFHQPGFSSSRTHFEQQQMRLLAPVFDKEKVDIVFSGHVHNYQRSFPMSFVPDKKGVMLVGGKDNKSVRGRVVNGAWTLDKSFDGKKHTKPGGVIYIVTGAGGQDLYNPEQENDPDSWQKFTEKFISTVHSISVVDVNGRSCILKQVSKTGKEVDEFTVTKD